jgi:hypothetical protein
MNFPPREELKAKWLEALRSGNYPQGKKRLRSEDGWCCLGVLCNVAGIPSAFGGGEWMDGKKVATFESGDFTVLPLELANHIGMSINGSFKEDQVGNGDYITINGHVYTALTQMNDGRGFETDVPASPSLTFAQIADVIEQNPDKIFSK